MRWKDKRMTAEGVEPSTIALKVRCSTTELRGQYTGDQGWFNKGLNWLAQGEYSRLVKCLRHWYL